MDQNGCFEMSFHESLIKGEKIHMAIDRAKEVMKVINPVGNKPQRSISLTVGWH
jgi:ribosomal protein L17